MKRMLLVVALVGFAVACGGGPGTYDPFDNDSVSIDVRRLESGDAVATLPVDLPEGETFLCVVEPELSEIRPLFDEGTAIFDADGQLVELTVQPIPDRITRLWDAGKLPGWGCAIN